MHNNAIEEQVGTSDFHNVPRSAGSERQLSITALGATSFVADRHHEDAAVGGFIPE